MARATFLTRHRQVTRTAALNSREIWGRFFHWMSFWPTPEPSGYNRPMNDDLQTTIHHILTHFHTFAVVGFSDRDRRRAAFYAPAYLKGHGYTVIPVNPRLETGLNRPAYPALADVPGPFDVALIYAASERVGPFVDQAIAAGAKAVWLPIGVVDEAAAERARAAGLLVVMDRCPMVEHKHMA